MRIKYYSRYMDDCILIHHDKNYLNDCLKYLNNYLENDLKLSFNEKTAIFPIKNGVDYLGWHFYLTKTGKIIRKVKTQTKRKYKRKLKYFQKAYSNDEIDFESIKQVVASYHAHLSFGHTYQLQRKILSEFKLIKSN